MGTSQIFYQIDRIQLNWIKSIPTAVHTSKRHSQGSSLSVPLFITTINELPNILLVFLNTIMFVNDTNIYCKGRKIIT